MSNWGGANRPITSNTLSSPTRGEGVDGDIQVRQTNLGAKLFAKIGGIWLDSPLAVNGRTKFGTSSSNYLSIDRDSIDIIKASKNVASFGATMRIGEDSTAKSALRVAADGTMTIGVKGGTPQFQVDADGDITYSGGLGEITSVIFGKLVVDTTTLVVNADAAPDKVGIGIAVPTELLHLYGGTSQTTLLVSTTAEDAILKLTVVSHEDWIMGIDNSDNGKLQFCNSSVPGTNVVMTLDPDSNAVGIGTTSPTAGLHIDGGSAHHVPSTSDEALVPALRVEQNGVDSVIDFGTTSSGVNRAYIHARSDRGTYDGSGFPLTLNELGGNVGIGTAAPTAKLHVNEETNLGTSVGDTQEFIKCEGDTDHADRLITQLIRLGTDSSGNDWTTAQWRIQRYIDTTWSSWIGFSAEEGSGTANHAIMFGIGNDSSESENVDEIMRIQGDGTVGIGTNDPNAKLEVNAGSATAIASFISSHATLDEIYIGEDKATNKNLVVGFNKTNDYGFLHIYGDSAGTGLVIADGSNIGIGVNDPDTKLEVLAGTTNQLKLSYDGTDNCTFGVDTAGDLTITPSGSNIIFGGWSSGDGIESSNFSSQADGWAIFHGTQGGNADFRHIFADELHVKNFIADIYSALAGGLIITKSRARVSREFQPPSTSGTATLYVEDHEGQENANVFVANDYVLVRIIDTSGGGLVVEDVYGQVTSPSDLSGGEQSWTFTTTTTGYTTSTSKTIGIGSVVLDYGVAGENNGIWEATVLDELSPYSQCKIWDGSITDGEPSGFSVATRVGNLDGISGIGAEYGLWAGYSSTNYIKAGSEGVFLRSDADTYINLDATGGPSNNTPAIEFFDTNKKMSIYGGHIVMYADNGSTIVSAWDDQVLQFGADLSTAADVDAINISSNGVKIYGSANTNFVNIDSAAVTIQSSAADKCVIDNTGMTVTSNSVTRLTALDTGVICYGDDANTYAQMTSAGMTIFNDGTVADPGTGVSHFGTTMRIGAVADDTSRLEIDNSGNLTIKNRQSTTDTTLITLSADGTATISGDVTIGGTSLTTTADNVFIGDTSTGTEMTTHANSVENIAIGTSAMENAEYGRWNVFLGFESGQNFGDDCASDAIVYGNVAIGYRSYKCVSSSNVLGSYNTAIGFQAMEDATGGSGSTCIGYRAGEGLTAGYNTLIGYNAGYNSGSGNITSGTNNICISAGDGNSNSAAMTNAADDDFAISIGAYCKAGDEGIAIGKTSLASGLTSIAIGREAEATGEQALAIGYNVTATEDYAIALGGNFENDDNLSVEIGYGIKTSNLDCSAGSASFTATSDERMKKNIVDSDLGLDFINALKPRKFLWVNDHDLPDEIRPKKLPPRREDSTVDVTGFIAQEVKAVIDSQNTTFSGWRDRKNSLQSLAYSDFVVPLTKAIQELSAKVDTMQEEINTLKQG